MTLPLDVVFGSAVRAAGVAALATVAASCVRPWLDLRVGRWAIAALLVTPGLMLGHVWAVHAPAALVDPTVRAWLYPVLLVARTLPVTAVIWWLIPPREPATTRHVARLGGARFAIDGRRLVTTAGVGLFHAFGEFEIAARLAVDQWTVVVFDAHAGGLAIGASVRAIVAPSLVSVAAIAIALMALRRGPVRSDVPGRRAARWPGAIVLLAALTVVVGLPLAWLLPDAIGGIGALVRHGRFGSEIAAGLAIGVVAAICANALALVVLRRPWSRGVLVLPGLLGSLVLSLLAIALFQAPGLGALYDTPLVWAVVATALLVPFALVFRLVVARIDPGSSFHAARLLGGRARALRWRLAGRRQAAAVVVLALLGTYEVTAAALLSPTGMTPASVRLYNLMHYERSQVLSAMLVAAVAAPLGLLGVVAGFVRVAVGGGRDG